MWKSNCQPACDSALNQRPRPWQDMCTHWNDHIPVESSYFCLAVMLCLTLFHRINPVLNAWNRLNTFLLLHPQTPFMPSRYNVCSHRTSLIMSPVFVLFQEPQSFDEFRGQFCEFSGKWRVNVLCNFYIHFVAQNADKKYCKIPFNNHFCFVMRFKEFPCQGQTFFFLLAQKQVWQTTYLYMTTFTSNVVL